jgi:hypothetical protein
VLLGVIALLGARMQPNSAKIEEHRLILVTAGKPPEKVEVPRSGILQVEAFRVPIVAAFQDSRLEVRLDGDRALQMIGQLRRPSDQDGSSTQNAFFLAIKTGSVHAHFRLVDSEGKAIEGFDVEYNIVVVAE